MRSANRFLRRFQSGAPSAERATPSDTGAIQVIGYDIEGLLAFGGQGAVYRAIQIGTGRTVAIKVPLADTQWRPSARYRFEREIELTARLDHPGIIRVIGPCELIDGRVGCVMEFIDGSPFDRWAAARRASGRGAIRQIVEAGVHVADAIAYAHLRAVLHRDIKPSNVVVTEEGVPRVLDFGLAKALGDSAQSFATVTGAFVGTLAHAAPEQVSSGADAIDMRTDVYALGLLLYQALTGRLPYSVDAPTLDILKQIRELTPPRPSSLASDIDDDLDAVLLTALAKEKDRRYATAAEFRDDLRAWLDGRAVRARFDSRWYLFRKSLHRNRWPAFLAAAGLAAILTTAALGLVAREQSSRAKLANAVRDARVLESHWVRMAEARSVGMDNFEAGERMAWDALLEPDRVLVENAIEGIDPSNRVPTSASYWALWEMYARTPVVFTVPDTSRSLVAYDSSRDAIVSTSGAERALTWWDWRSGTRLRSIPSEEAASAVGFVTSPDGRWGAVVTAEGDATLVDLESGRARAIGEVRDVVGIRITDDRVALGIRRPDGAIASRLWAFTENRLELIATHALGSPVASAAFDASGAFLAIMPEGGELLVVDAAAGTEVHRRPANAQPRYFKVHSRGNPGEFVLSGPARVATFQVDDPAGAIGSAIAGGSFLEGVSHVSGARHADRYVAISDRFRVGVGQRSTPLTLGSYFPALSASNVAISDDGRYAGGLARPSRRAIVIDLDSRGIIRLPFSAPITESGFATVFGLVFSPDSQRLWAGAMDGSVRCFSVAAGGTPVGESRNVNGGVTALRVDHEDVFVGTHDLGLSTARVMRLRDGGAATELIPGGERWIACIELDDDRSLWALTGEGRLLMIDAGGGVLRSTRLTPHPDWRNFRAMARIADRGLLLIAPAGDGLVILDQDSLEPVAPSIPMPPIRELIVSPVDPTLIATAGDDGNARLWRLNPDLTLDPIREFGTHAGAIFALAFSPDGRILATGGGTPEARDVRLWDVANGRELAALDLFEQGVFELAFSPDGRWLAAGGEVRFDAPQEGGQLYLIDLHAPARSVAGNLEYHIARLSAERGREPSQAAALRRWAASLRERSDTPSGSP
jgi:WD40 repeat protein/predicted Ser/Thr protein kinase